MGYVLKGQLNVFRICKRPLSTESSYAITENAFDVAARCFRKLKPHGLLS